MNKIGYLGPKGSFTYIAMTAYLKRSSDVYEPVSYSNFFDLFDALNSKEISHMIIPIENSLGGEVYSTLDGLMTLPDTITITAEQLMPIEQSLLAAHQTKASDIKQIYTHPQSYTQCSKHIKAYYADAEFIACASNADAAIQVSESVKPGIASIGHRSLAELYNLSVLQDNISDADDNTTRFVVLSSDISSPSSNDKSSFVFSSHKDKPGSLCNVLLELSKRGINMTRITSRPSKGVLGEYVFFIDCDGHVSDLKDCLDAIKETTGYFKFLGSYQKGE